MTLQHEAIKATALSNKENLDMLAKYANGSAQICGLLHYISHRRISVSIYAVNRDTAFDQCQ